MHRSFRLAVAFALMLALNMNAPAQIVSAQEEGRGAAAQVTATATAERVRFAAPASVVQLRLEVYDESGRKLFDTEQRGGNVLDWHLSDGAGQRAPEGTYACVLTIKSLTGRLTQRLGEVTVTAQGAEVRAAQAARLPEVVRQAVGPVEEDAALAVLTGAGEAPAAAVVAHTGAEGQLSRTRGALSFRVGDFFSGLDREQMRLTEDGRLGLGTSKPRARLDVAGDIRASGRLLVAKGIEFPDGTVQTSAVGSGGAGGAKGVQGAASVAADLTVDGNIVFTSPGQLNYGRDIQLSDNLGGLRFFGAPSLTASPAGAAIQFFGNGHTLFPGQAFVDSGAHNSAAVIFRTAQTSGTIAERMRIASNGNVGVGTSAPAAKLDVNGTVRFSPGGSGGVVEFGPAGGETGMGIISSGFNTRADVRFDGGSLKLLAGLGTSAPPSTSGLVVNTAGNVGVGTAAPSVGRLHVSGGAGQPAVYGVSPNRGVYGVSTGSSYGVYGESGSGIGVQGESTSNVGVGGVSNTNDGVAGTSTSGVGVRGQTASTSIAAPGVRGVSTGAGGVGVRGDGTTGVYGVSTSGVGVTGESATGFAVYANGNAGQPADKNGFIKAMLFVSMEPATPQVLRCYNGVTNSSTGTCGVTVSRGGFGIARLAFNFPVANRFVSITTQFGNGSFNPHINNSGATFNFFNDTTIDVFTHLEGSEDTFDVDFMIIVF